MYAHQQNVCNKNIYRLKSKFDKGRTSRLLQTQTDRQWLLLARNYQWAALELGQTLHAGCHLSR